MLEQSLEANDWYNVCFSDETHFGFSAEGKPWLYLDPGESNCPSRPVEKQQPPAVDYQDVHCRAIMGSIF
jgi:hypothetical protein